MTSEGLLIRNVSRQDEGGFICRARVAETGQLEERIIQLEVILLMLLLSVMIMISFQLQEIPTWIRKPLDETFLEGKSALLLMSIIRVLIKGETAKIECSVSASPYAEYSWRKQWPINFQHSKGIQWSQLVVQLHHRNELQTV